MSDLLYDMALCTVAAWVLGVIAQFARQPVILAYLIGGFLLGPSGFALIKSKETITTISELGLIFLLFMIGLEIDLKKIVRSGSTILVSAVAQIAGCTLLGIGLFVLLGLPLGGGQWDALYLGVAAALSSTVIIVKILYDKRELDTLPGRITLGILVLQDLFVILFLAIQPSLNDLRVTVLLVSLVRVAALVATALVVSRFVLPRLFFHIARLPELVLVGALAWCLFLGQLADELHLSREMGALVAGVSLSTFPYALDVAAKVTSLRDFFVTLFFVGVGLAIPVPAPEALLYAAGLGVFVVASRLLTVVPTLMALRQGLRASLLPAINLAQLSEFSLVLLQIGITAKHISTTTATAASVAFVVMAALSTFAMNGSDGLVRGALPLMKRLDCATSITGGRTKAATSRRAPASSCSASSAPRVRSWPSSRRIGPRRWTSSRSSTSTPWSIRRCASARCGSSTATSPSARRWRRPACRRPRCWSAPCRTSCSRGPPTSAWSASCVPSTRRPPSWHRPIS